MHDFTQECVSAFDYQMSGSLDMPYNAFFLGGKLWIVFEST